MTKTLDQTTTLTSAAIQPLVPLLKPIDIKRAARVPYQTVIHWVEVGHPRAGRLPSIDLAEAGKRHSYRIAPADWEAFQRKLTSTAKPERPPAAACEPRPRKPAKGTFRY